MIEQKIVGTESFVKVVERLNQFAARGMQTTPVMEEIATDMLRVEEQVFKSNGRRGGGSWKRLKKDTIRRKGDSEILRTRNAKPGYGVGNDALFRSVTVRGANYQIWDVTRRAIEFGTTVPGAAANQFGSRGGIPARPFLKFTQGDLDRWTAMIERHVVSLRNG